MKLTMFWKWGIFSFLISILIVFSNDSLAGKDKPPTGAAGGDLTGFYPDPTIIPGVTLDDPSINGTLSIASGDNALVGCSGPSIGIPTLVGNATRTAGQVIFYSGAGSVQRCTLTFNFGYTHRPICTVSTVSATGTFYGLSVLETVPPDPPVNSNQIVVLMEGPIGNGDGFSYHCIDH